MSAGNDYAEITYSAVRVRHEVLSWSRATLCSKSHELDMKRVALSRGITARL